MFRSIFGLDNVPMKINGDDQKQLKTGRFPIGTWKY